MYLFLLLFFWQAFSIESKMDMTKTYHIAMVYLTVLSDIINSFFKYRFSSLDEGCFHPFKLSDSFFFYHQRMSNLVKCFSTYIKIASSLCFSLCKLSD